MLNVYIIYIGNCYMSPSKSWMSPSTCTPHLFFLFSKCKSMRTWQQIQKFISWRLRINRLLLDAYASVNYCCIQPSCLFHNSSTCISTSINSKGHIMSNTSGRFVWGNTWRVNHSKSLYSTAGATSQESSSHILVDVEENDLNSYAPISSWA